MKQQSFKGNRIIAQTLGFVREISLTKILVSTAAVLGGSLMFGVQTASAQSSFTDHVWKFANGAATNVIDFNGGKSKIYTNSSSHNLRLESQGNIVLNTTRQVIVNNSLSVGGNANVGSSASVYTDNTNHNCDEACVDLTPSDDGGKSAVLEFQGDPSTSGATESSGIALNSDTANIWSPGDNGLLNVFDEDNFCTGCSIGPVGSDADVTAAFTVDGNGGVQATGSSEFFGDLTVDGTFIAAGFADPDITATAGDFEVTGDLTVDGSAIISDLTSTDGTYVYRNGDDYGTVLNVSDGDGFSVLNVNTSCDGDGYSCVTVNEGTDGGEFDVNADSYLNNDVFIDGETTHYSDVYLADSAVLRSGVSGCGYTGESADAVCVGTDGSNNDFAVWGDTYLDGETIFGGRLYGAGHIDGDTTGDPVTIGRYAGGDSTYHPGLTVWGDSALRGNVVVGGDDSNWSDTTFQVQDPDTNVIFNVGADCGFDGGGCVTLGADNYYSNIFVNGRLYGTDGDPVTIGHHSDQSGLKVWGDSDLRGNLQVGGWGSDGTGIDVQNGDLNVNNGDLWVDGSAEFNNYSYFDNGAEFDNGTDYYGDINVWDGNSININDNGNLYVDGTAEVQNLTIDNTMTFNGTTHYNAGTSYDGSATYNGSATFNGSLTAGSTTLSGALTATSATFSNNVTVNSTLTATAGVDFSGASSLRVPVIGTALVDNSTVCSTTGLLTYTTNSSHLFVCDGAHWQKLADIQDLSI